MTLYKRIGVLIVLLCCWAISALGQCTLSVSLTASNNAAICSGSSVVLTATATNGTAPYTYTWSTGETTSSISVNKAATYSVTISDNTPGCQPVSQSIAVTSAPVPDPPTVAGATVCKNTSVTLTATAPGGLYQWYDAPTGGHLINTGVSYITPPITAATTYYVETTLSGCTSARSPVTINLSGNPTVSGAQVCAGNQATLSAAGGSSYTWYSTPGGQPVATGPTFVTPPLSATTTYYVVAVINGCTGVATPVTATVSAFPQGPAVQGATICYGSSANLQANASGVIDWFSVPTGGTSLITSPVYTTPNLTATTTYYVQNTSNNCVSARTPVTVTVIPVPVAPSVQPVTVCPGAGALLTASSPSGTTFNWYADAAGAVLLATGANYQTPALTGNTTYYVQTIEQGCTGSTLTPLPVTVSNPPTAPTVTVTPACPGSAATLTATAPGGTYQWYDAPSGGNLLAAGPTFTTPNLTANIVYYVQTTLNGCISSRTAVTATLYAPATPPTVNNTTICPGSATTLVASGNDTYQWYDAATGGNLLMTGPAFTTPALTVTTTYYVQTTSNGCAGTIPRTPVTVTVSPVPAQPTVSPPSTTCPNSAASLTASVPAGTINWYDSATGGNLLATGNNFTTPLLTASTTYYVQNTLGGCSSPRTAVTVPVVAVTTPQFDYSSGTLCNTGANETPVISDQAGGVFSSAPAGLVFVSNTTGEINVSASATGAYTITFTGNESCHVTTQSTLSITSSPNGKFSYNGPFCQYAKANPSPVFVAGASAGTFSATPAGLVFVNATTGQINLQKSAPGTYTVSNNIPATGSCPQITTTSTVTISPGALVSAGPNQVVGAGSKVQLAGSITGVPGGKWTGGTGTFSNATLPNAIYTPGAGETKAMLTFTSDAAPGNCGANSSQMTITFVPVPTAPVAAGATICSGNTVTLSATAPGGTYTWYDAPTGGNLLATSADFTTPVLTANTTYYVETTTLGGTSTRTTVPVVVTPLPAAPVAAPVSACVNTKVILTAHGSTGNYEWYDRPTGGILLGKGGTYTTPQLTANVTYYLQATGNGCASMRTAVPVSVITVTFPQFQYSTGTFCSTDTTETPTISDPAGGIFSALPAGLVFANTSTGEIDVNASKVGIYTVSFTGNESCHTVTQATLTVVASPQADFAYNGPFCQYAATNPSPVFGPGASAGTFSATPAGLVFLSNTSGQIDLQNSIPGTYTVTNTILATGSCPQVSATSTVTINAGALANAGPDQTVPPGTPVQLAGSVTGVASGTWTGGTGTFSNPALLNAVYTPGPGETSAVLKLTSAAPPGNCGPNSSKITITFAPVPSAPAAAGETICSGGTATLSATAPGGNYSWYDAPAGGNLLGTGPDFTTTALTATTTYYVQTTTLGGTSPITAVVVTVTPLPAAPVVAPVTACVNTAVTLTAQGSTGSYQWYNVASGGSVLATGSTFTTPVLTSNTTYYVAATGSGCASPRTAVTVPVVAVTTPQFQYSSGTFCSSDANETPVINDPAGGVFSAAPAGLVFESNATGEINVSASSLGKYTITFVGNESCQVSTQSVISIVTAPSAKFSYNGPFCQYSGTNPLPVFAAGASAGSFSAAPAGLVFINSTTGQIDIQNSAPGTYMVTNTIQASGSCPQTSATASVTISQGVLVNAGSDQTTGAGNTVQLAGSVNGASGGKWTGGLGTFSNPALLNAVYTPGAGETSAVLTLTSNPPPGNCGAGSSQVVITIVPPPTAPVAADDTICTDNSVTLLATAPGGTYTWYDAPAAGNLLATGPTFTTPRLNATTTYYVQTTTIGGTGPRTPVVVTVNSVSAPTASSISACINTSATLTAQGSTGNYEWFSAATGGTMLATGSTFTSPALTSNTTYYVEAVGNGCASVPVPVNVTVISTPVFTSASAATICSGNALNYVITTNIPSATFSWSRQQVAGISNPAVTGDVSGTIAETLINTTQLPVKVIYNITATTPGCNLNSSFQYVVTVLPSSAVTSPAKIIVCDGVPLTYAITFTDSLTTFRWSRAAVPGISNAPVTGQATDTIQETLYNTTNAPIDVTYVITYSKGSCPGTFNLVATVGPQVTITSPAVDSACYGEPFNYTITSNVPGATYTWSRATGPFISNPPVLNQTSSTINETLFNTNPNASVNAQYTIIASAYGCQFAQFTLNVNVFPMLPAPLAVNSNSPVCVGSTIQLQTPVVPNAGYLWTGPNGYTSNQQNPIIPNATAADSGAYTLSLLIGHCIGPPLSTNVTLDALAVVNAGPNQIVCIDQTTVNLSGSVTGGTTTGIWSTSGTGIFQPSVGTLNAQYVPSAQDKANGSVTLTLASTSSDNCSVVTSNTTITFGATPAVSAGPGQDACAETTGVQLNGQELKPGESVQWTTSGSGTFSPSDTLLNASYVPSAADVKNGSITLTLTDVKAGVCDIPADTTVIKLIPPPTVYAGATKYLLAGQTATLQPVVNEDSVQYLWAPDENISNNTIKNPVITGANDITYTLTVTDPRGCTSQSQVMVVIAPAITVDNAFTPNGDGINDYWDITGLIAYINADVQVFDRYGALVFHSIGYGKPWDGTVNGRPLPQGTYYYIIKLNYHDQVLSGAVTIIR